MTKTMEAQELALAPQGDLDQIGKIDAISRAAANQLASAGRNEMLKTIVMARGIKQLREALTDRVMADICELQNCALGFKTDREQGYSVGEVRDVVTQALLRGLRVVGNEFNIIAGNLYVTKEGLSRLVAEFPGLSNLKVELGVPEMRGEVGALVPARATWNLHGVTDAICCEAGEVDYRIPIRVNKAMGVDAIHGKAKSKLLRRVYERLTGSALLAVEEAEDVPAEVVSDAKP